MKKEFWMVIFATILMTIAQYFYKTGALNYPASEGILRIAIAFILYFIVAGIMLLVLRKQELSYAYPLLATSFIWVGLVSYFIFGETLTLLNWTGI